MLTNNFNSYSFHSKILFVSFRVHLWTVLFAFLLFFVCLRYFVSSCLRFILNSVEGPRSDYPHPVATASPSSTCSIPAARSFRAAPPALPLSSKSAAHPTPAPRQYNSSPNPAAAPENPRPAASAENPRTP